MLKPTTILSCLAMCSLAIVFTGCNRYDYDHDRSGKATAYRVGTTYNTLPRGYRSVAVDGRDYYYSGGNYFQRRDRGYVAVERPYRYPRTRTRARIGASVSTLPKRHHTIRYGNRNYYYADGSYYRPRGGTYVTVRSPFG
ncbi:MAG: DUF6515 family protein [Verrucomicrobiales bacterium]